MIRSTTVEEITRNNVPCLVTLPLDMGAVATKVGEGLMDISALDAGDSGDAGNSECKSQRRRFCRKYELLFQI